MEVIRGGERILIKKYVVRLDAEERDRTQNELIRKGKRSAQLLTKARILLEGGRIGCGRRLERQPGSPRHWTPASPLSSGTRRQLVEEGFEAVLARKYNSNSARRRIFDGAAEAKLIALTLSPAPAGFAQMEPASAEEKVVELHIVEPRQRQHDRADAKKNISSRIASSNG